MQSRLSDAERFELDVQKGLHRRRVQEEIARRSKEDTEAFAEFGGRFEMPVIVGPVKAERNMRYRIDNVMPIGTYTLLYAGYKAGKTTLLADNLVPSLLNGTPFLGKYDTAPIDGSVMFFNCEMGHEMFEDWVRDAGIRGSRFRFASFRGMCQQLDVRKPRTQAHWVNVLREADTKHLIVDPIGPIARAVGINEDSNTEMGRLIGAFQALCAEAGVPEMTISHHTGHEGTHARGASVMHDIPDTVLKLTKNKITDVRTFTIEAGRDVTPASFRLSYIDQMRKYIAADEADGSDAPLSENEKRVQAAIKDDWQTVTQLHETVGDNVMSRKTVEAMLGQLIERREDIEVDPGRPRKVRWMP